MSSSGGGAGGAGGAGAPRKSFARGQMTRGTNSGPAIMMMPPHIRATFMPNPPLKHILPLVKKRKTKWTGMTPFLQRAVQQKLLVESTQERNNNKHSRPDDLHDSKQDTTKAITPRARRMEQRQKQHMAELQPLIEEYRKAQKESSGEYEGMNCYNTLFIGRLAYEVTERKLLRELEVFGPVKDLKLITTPTTADTTATNGKKSRGYAFCEYEQEEDMKRAYRAADGLCLEGRAIVVDVERGHTVPNWLPRRLGGGLGGTRLGGPQENITTPGRFDPAKQQPHHHHPHSIQPNHHAMPGPGGGPQGFPPYGGPGPSRSGFGRGAGPGPGHGPPMSHNISPPMQPPPPHGGYDRGGAGGMGRGASAGGMGRGGSFGGPPRGQWERNGGPPMAPPPRFDDRSAGSAGGWDRKRQHSRSPERRHPNSRRRY